MLCKCIEHSTAQIDYNQDYHLFNNFNNLLFTKVEVKSGKWWIFFKLVYTTRVEKINSTKNNIICGSKLKNDQFLDWGLHMPRWI